MDIKAINFTNCSCGQEHGKLNMIVEIGPGLLKKTAEILKDFPKLILVVADKNTLAASDGLMDTLKAGGFDCTLNCYDNCTEANILQVEELGKVAAPFDGILAVGSGSISDICRMAAYRANKAFAIFATAASMDGFASSAAPITFGCYKKTVICKIPDVIIGDTEILAKAPAALKSAGFADIIAKYLALYDWKITSLISDEFYCPNVAMLVKDALEKAVSLADRVTNENPATAFVMMEALVLSGIAMALSNSTRPASAAEHLLSHFWEMRKLERHEPVAFHGTKVGVGTLLIVRLYQNIADNAYGSPVFQSAVIDWKAVYDVFGPDMEDEIEQINNPSVLEKTSPEILEKYWTEIKRLIKEQLPLYEDLLQLMNSADCLTNIKDIDVDEQLALEALEFHPYMRHRMNLTTLIPMLGIKPDYKGLLI